MNTDRITNSNFHTLSIESIIPDTQDAVVVRFHIPSNLVDAFTFTPGQYLTLRAQVNGEDIRRSYSICSSVNESSLAVGVKRLSDGQFSTHVHGLQSGDTLDVMPPQGRFTTPLGGSHHYLLLAAGSGVTPIYSIARSVLENEPDSVISLCYVNKTIDSVMFKTELDELKDRFMTRFLLTHLMTAEAQDVTLFNGRLDREKLDTMVTRGLIAPTSYDAIYVCGPEAMIKSTQQAMLDFGVEESCIRFELFTSSSTHAPRTPKDNEDSPVEGAEVHVILDGSQRSFTLPPDTPLMDAAAKAGLELPWSCANGMCATCRCKLVDGEITMRQNFSLDPWEIDAGYVLACQVQAQSEKLVLDFDEV